MHTTGFYGAVARTELITDLYTFPFFVFMSTWKAKCYIFSGLRLKVQKVVANILGLLKDYPDVPRVSRCRMIGTGLVVGNATGFF